MVNNVFKKLFISAMAFLVLTTSAMAASVTLAWDPNDPTPEGYKIFVREQGQTYDYNNPAWSGPETRHTLDLTEGTLYYFVVRAYDGVLESGDSVEINYAVPTQGIDAPTGTQIEKVIIININ